MAYTTINKSSLHMNPVDYMGNGTTKSVTGVGFQPDLVWLKKRGNAANHMLFDAVRGVTKVLYVNTSSVEGTEAQSLTTFGTDGFTVGTETDINQEDQTQMSWNWKANGAGSANTDGTINTTATSANTTSGFSILTYSGTGSGGGTIGHGLGAKPRLFICRHLNADGNNWQVWVDTTGNGTSDQRLLLNGQGNNYNNNHITFGTSTITLPSSSADGWSGSVKNYVGYAFLQKTGFSKFGTYYANNNADGNFVYLGFKPSFLMVKASAGGSSGSRDWQLVDSKRLGYNVNNNCLFPNLNNAEDTGDVVDLLSNGFKIRSTTGTWNTSGETYTYIAFGQTMVGTNNIPATAR